MGRIAKDMKKTPEERELELEAPTRVPPHALSDDDKERIRAHIEAYELEPGYPCAHREPLLYFHDGGKQWTDVYDDYIKGLKDGERQVSSNRFREYVRSFFPRLRLKRHETDVCNVCFKITTELKDETLSDARRDELKAMKDAHIGKKLALQLVFVFRIWYDIVSNKLSSLLAKK